MPPILESPAVLLLRQPLPDVAAWAAHFQTAQIPVLAGSAEALEALRAHEDDVDANLIGEMVGSDPLMTLHVLSYAATHRPPRMVTDTGTVTAAVVMMGIGPFFRAFGPLPTVEYRLREWPAALAGWSAQQADAAMQACRRWIAGHRIVVPDAGRA